MTDPESATAPDAAAPAEVDPASFGVDGGGPVRLLDAGEIRARRRLPTIAIVWIWELLGALLLATPVHAWAKAVFAAHPDGDSVLFRRGGHELMTWLGENTTSIGIVVRTTVVMLVVLGLVGQLVTGTVIASLASGVSKRGRTPPFAFALRAGASAFCPLIGLEVGAIAVEGLVFAAAVASATAVDDALEARLGDASAFFWSMIVFAALVALALVIGVAFDLARVAVARQAARRLCEVGSKPRLRDAVAPAARTARKALGSAVFAWGWRAAIAVALVTAGARAGDVVGPRGGGTLWLLFGFHQTIIFARAGLRASWLANALRLVVANDEPARPQEAL